MFVKDSSANKCGVICSSFEIVSSMLMSSEEFTKSKVSAYLPVLCVWGYVVYKTWRRHWQYRVELFHFSKIPVIFPIAQRRTYPGEPQMFSPIRSET